MKKLVILAHPAKESFNRDILDTFIENSKDHEVFFMDLYDPEFAQPFLAYEKISEYGEDANRKKIQEKIAWADELVFAYPVWWGSVPAILKNFFDTNFTAGFAFQYMKGSPLPKKLLVGKTAKVFCTCDAPAAFYWIVGAPFKKAIKTLTLQYCGVKVTDFVLFDRLRKKDDVARDKLLVKVAKIAQK